MRRKITSLTLCTAIALASCSTEADESTNETTAAATSATNHSDDDEADAQLFPDVIDAELSASGDQFSISVTISSPYDSPDRYADGWRVMTVDGEVLAEHDLAHDHANEQPFTRSRGPFEIPGDVEVVVVEGRDLKNGYGGGTVEVPVPR